MNEIHKLYKKNYAKLTKTEKRIAEFISKNPKKLITLSALELGKELGVSDASVLRFSKNIGFNKFSDFKNYVALELSEGNLNERIVKNWNNFTSENDLANKIINADLRKIVRRLDGKICSLLEPFSNSFFLSMGISEIIKGELNERIDYNNIREKLSGRERKEYLEDILSDIKDKYSTFLLHLLKQSRDINEYPDWESIEKSIRDLINNWEEEVISLLSHHIGEKIKIYINAKDDFKTAEYVENSITYPIEKNKKYLKELGGNVCSY